MIKIYQSAIAGMVFLTTIAVSAQTQNVGIGTNQPDESAVLDIQSINKGLLIPRMSVEERNKIINPANGLLIFQTDAKSGFYYFGSDAWKPMTTNEAKSVQGDPNDWSLNGNAVTGGFTTAATASSFIGTPANVPINFKIGSQQAGKIDQASRNTLFGFESGKATTGTDNASIGYFALRANTTGIGNLAIGTYSLINSGSGDYNVGIGTSTLQQNSSGSHNIGIGIGALRSALGDRNVAIGVFAGFTSAGSRNVFIGNDAGRFETGSNKLYLSNNNSANPLIKGDFLDKNLRINVGASNGAANSATTLGYMAIGNFDAASPMAIPSGYRLVVESGILTEKIKVALKSSTVGPDWADYVFESDYKLMPLEEVENFTKKNKHLPNVPSADEMVASGLDVAQTSKMFMEKIEELTLYMIELNKEVKSLKAENEILKAKLK